MFQIRGKMHGDLEPMMRFSEVLQLYYILKRHIFTHSKTKQNKLTKSSVRTAVRYLTEPRLSIMT